MSIVNYNSKEIFCKIVYYGPLSSGKTTNIKYIYKKLNEQKSNSLSEFEIDLSAEKAKQTLFFDFLPIFAGRIKSMKVYFHLYTVPGDKSSSETRRMLLQSSDAVIFVADSSYSKREENKESFLELKKYLELKQIDIQKFPLILQYNKRDLEDKMSVKEMSADLNFNNFFESEAIANQDKGVVASFQKACNLVLESIKK